MTDDTMNDKVLDTTRVTHNLDNMDTAQMQQIMIQDIVVQNDVPSQDVVASRSTTSRDNMFADDESQSDTLFPVADSTSQPLIYDQDVASCNIPEQQPTIFLQDVTVSQPIGLHGTNVDQTFPNAYQTNSFILHADSSSDNLLLDGVDATLLRSNIQPIIFSDGSSSQPFAIANNFHQQPVITQSESDSNSQQSFFIRYMLPTSNIHVASQNLPLLQAPQTLDVQQPEKTGGTFIANDANVYLATESITNGQPIVITAAQTESSNQPDSTAIGEQMATSSDKGQKFFIQGGTPQNNQLLQQVLAMWSSGESAANQPTKLSSKLDSMQVGSDASVAAPDACTVDGHKCSVCSKLFKSISSSTQTDSLLDFHDSADTRRPRISDSPLEYINEDATDLTNRDIVNLSAVDAVGFVHKDTVLVSEETNDLVSDDTINLGDDGRICLVNSDNSNISDGIGVMNHAVDDGSSEANRDGSFVLGDMPENLVAETNKESALLTTTRAESAPSVKRRKLTLVKVGADDHACKFCGVQFKRLGELVSHTKEAHPQHANGDGKDGQLSVFFTVQKANGGIPKPIYQCEVCRLSLVNFYSLRLHSQLHGKYKHRCKVCSLLFISIENLASHTLNYHKLNREACQLCKETFGTKQEALSHLCYFKPSQPTKETVHCGLCFNTFLNQKDYRLHKFLDHKAVVKTKRHRESDFECPECNYVCHSWAILQGHMRTHSGERPFECDICSKRFTFKHILKRHKQSHSGVKLHACLVCGNRYCDARTLQRHMSIHTGKCKYSCDKCDKKFMWLATLNRHVVTHEPGYVPDRYICDYCGKVFTNKHSSVVHNRLHTGERPFSCEVCGKGFIEQRTLRFHMSKHTGERPHQCTECGKRYSRLEGLKMHLRSHNPEKMFNCAQCPKSFNSQQGLMNHVHVHTGQKPFMCEVCPRRFTSINSLRKHSMRHSNDRPFVCEICSKAFKEKYVLQVHERTHMTGDKQFKCTICGHGFRQSCTLNVHMRRHTGEKPYSCDDCKVCFSTTSSLHRHRRIHTGECPYQCDQCDKKFRLIAGLKSHIQRHHKDKKIHLPQ